MTEHGTSRVMQAIDLLRRFERDEAVGLLREELATGPPEGPGWRAVATLSAEIGEVTLALEAARRAAATQPQTLSGLMSYWNVALEYGREALVEEGLARLPDGIRRHPTVLHLEGTLATQRGDFDLAQMLFRRALHQSPAMPQTWFALAMITTFSADRRDVAALEAATRQMGDIDPALEARLFYARAKAQHDLGEHQRAFALYTQGAELRRSIEPFADMNLKDYVANVISGFDRDGLDRLTPSGAEPVPHIFVTGMPRSGTTLVEQILTSHSAISDGAETGLFKAALLPAGDRTLAGALAYQNRADQRGVTDPWGRIGATYQRLMSERFGPEVKAVDKTLVMSHFIGLLLHVLPGARVIWMRRDPEDVALSCFRTFFSSRLAWTWRLDDIALFMTLEDALHAHWKRLFPERILTVQYEDLVTHPRLWIDRIQDHVGLARQEAPHRFTDNVRSVRTASVQQVRSGISTDAIGKASAYASYLAPFRAAYFDRDPV